MKVDVDISAIVAEVKAELSASQVSTGSPWVRGKNYFIRTVTHYLTGKLIEVTDKELVLTDAAWIADTGRYASAMKEGSFKEVEPYPDGQHVIVGRGAVIDATELKGELPRSQKG